MIYDPNSIIFEWPPGGDIGYLPLYEQIAFFRPKEENARRLVESIMLSKRRWLRKASNPPKI